MRRRRIARAMVATAAFFVLAVTGVATAYGLSDRQPCPGNSCHTTSTTTTTTTTTPPPPSPSGQPMPVGDITGWHQIFTDDFLTNVPLGSFPASVSDKWDSYPYPWSGTPSWATYDSTRTTSFHDGVQDIWIHTEGSEHLIAANLPLVNGPGTSRLNSQRLYGRYVVRFKWDAFAGFKPSWLLWPQDGNWPYNGEIDFPETSSFASTQMCAFMHRQNGTSAGDQDAYCGAAGAFTPTSWHTAIIEWLPTRCTFILDGVVLGNSTSRIPSTPMFYVLQNGGSSSESTAQGHIYIDWVAVWVPN